MSDPTEARTRLRQKFQPYLAANVCAGVRHVSEAEAEKHLPRLNEWLEIHFDPAWPEVRANYGGTMGHHTAFMQAKVNWLAHYLESGDLESPLAHACLKRLNEFWREWAGFQVTASDDFSALLGDG